MQTKIPKLFVALGATCALLAASATSRAGPIHGSLALAGMGVSENGTNLLNSTSFATLGDFTTAPGAGDYAAVGPVGSGYTAMPLKLTNFGSFLFNSATFGTFAASSGSVVSSGNPAPGQYFLNVLELGTYTPGHRLASGVTPGPTSVLISLTQSGTSISESLTLQSPPVIPTSGGGGGVHSSAVPEPSSVGLAGIAGLVGLGCYLVRRRRVPA